LGGWLFDLGVGSGGVRGVMFYCLFFFAFEGERFSFFLVYCLVVYSTEQCWLVFLFAFPCFFAGFSMLPVRASTPSLSSWRLT